MTITKKPGKADKFINKAKADMNRQVIKKRMRTTKKETSAKTTQMTFYMTEEMYLAFQKYKLEQRAAGKKITFQGTVERYLEKLLS
jgi:hypothetical protein